jgi:hypothetical protein
MAENSRKWVGSTHVKQTQYGDMYKVGLNAEHLEMLKQHLNDKGWVNIMVASKKDGNGSSWIDEYVPQGGGNSAPAPVNGGESDLPF